MAWLCRTAFLFVAGVLCCSGVDHSPSQWESGGVAPFPPRSLHGTVTVEVGGGVHRVLVFGGLSVNHTAHSDVWASDDGGRSWLELSAAPWALFGFAHTSVKGDVFLFGGESCGALSEPSGCTASDTVMAPLRRDKWAASATSCFHNSVWRSRDGGDVWEAMDPPSGSPWRPRSGAAVASTSPSSPGLPSTLYLFGGSGCHNAPLCTIRSVFNDVWQASSANPGDWTRVVSPGLTPRANAGAAVLQGHLVLAYGVTCDTKTGTSRATTSVDWFMSNPGSTTVQVVTPPDPDTDLTPSHSASVVYDGQYLFMFGGCLAPSPSSGQCLSPGESKAARFDVQAPHFASAASSPMGPVLDARATVIRDRMLITGGRSPGASSNLWFATRQLLCAYVPHNDKNGWNCINGTVSCDFGWQGRSCDIPICAPVCGEHAVCVAPFLCSCIDNWFGLTCHLKPGKKVVTWVSSALLAVMIASLLLPCWWSILWRTLSLTSPRMVEKQPLPTFIDKLLSDTGTEAEDARRVADLGQSSPLYSTPAQPDRPDDSNSSVLSDQRVPLLREYT